mmetsp:Transcript_81873/g.175412  ORF Transcript_81873/g.175412 Transcript_81873/m.175412 type:complete len:350 (-) Transcript_81873:45-1094(-)
MQHVRCLWLPLAIVLEQQYISGAGTAPKYFDDPHSVEDAEEALEEVQEQAKYVMCGVDVAQAMFALGRSGTAINAAVKVCTPMVYGDPHGHDTSGRRRHNSWHAWSSERQAECSAASSEIINALAEAASFLSAAASNCAEELNVKAYCSADVTGFIASLTQIAASGSIMHAVCGKGPGDGSANDRRLISEETEAKIEKVEKIQERQAQDAECALDVGQATLFLVRASMAINAAAEECQNTKIREEKDAKAICAVDINGVIGSFSYAGEFISFAVAHCPLATSANAECAAAAIQIIAALASFAAAGFSFRLTCGGDLKTNDDPELEMPEHPYRRLAYNMSNKLTGMGVFV